MAKVKPNLKSDEDSAVEFSKSASESDQSPREDLFPEIDLKYPKFYASDSEFSDDDDICSSAVSSSTYNMVQSPPARVKIISKKISLRPENPRGLTRKGRKRSIEDDENILEEELSRASHKHQSKNAINARINRIKKKKYMQSLENSLERYRDECKRWQAEYCQKKSEVQSLQNEVKYLKAVIRNESKLGALVRNFGQCGSAPQSQSEADANVTRSSLPTIKGTNLSQTTTVNPNLCKCKNNDTSSPEIISDFTSNEFSKTNDFFNFETTSLHTDLDLPVTEDTNFNSVFPSACDFFNFDLPESFAESDLLSPDAFGESAMDLDSASNSDDVGICLHVSTVSGISLEFCQHCSKSPFSELLDVSLMA